MTEVRQELGNLMANKNGLGVNEKKPNQDKKTSTNTPCWLRLMEQLVTHS
jgi:hypothetical protein